MVSPFDAAKGVQDGKVLVTIPENQASVAGSFDPAAGLSVASATALDQPVSFKNVMSLLKINVPSDLDGKVVKITVEAKSGESLAGDILVDPATKANAVSSNGKSSVSLLASPSIAAANYYMVVRPCAVAKGIKVTVLLGDKTVYTRESSSAFEFAANTIYDMGAVGTTGWSMTTTEYSVTTVLGSVTATSNNEIKTGTGAEARLRSPQEIDMAPDGNFWITTRFHAANHGVWKMTPDYTLSKIVVVADDSDLTESHVWGAAFDANGKYFIAAKNLKKILTCSAEGAVEPLQLKKDGADYLVANPMMVDFDAQGNMFVLYRTKLVKFDGYNVVQEWTIPETYTDALCFNADKSKILVFGYTNIYQIDVKNSSTEVKKIAGGASKHTNASTYTDGTMCKPLTATFNTCYGTICLADGTIMFGDASAKTMRLLIPDVYGNFENATIKTVLGGAWSGGVASNAQAINAKDGKGTAGLLSSPAGMCFDAQGNVLFVDGLQNGMIRKITWETVTEKCGMNGNHQDYVGTDDMITIF
jgi:sugar lactone lactonase YvrE